jgi:RNA polymerase sigma-70 factor, ECF subfamily
MSSANAQRLLVEPGPLSQELRDLYAQELDYVCRSLTRLGAQPKDLEDLAHDVFLVVHARLGTYDRSRPLRPWLFGIAFRVMSEVRHRPALTREVGGAQLEEVGIDAAAEARVAERETRELVLQALAKLEPNRRAVFVMHELDGHSAPEISATLGVPLNTVYSRLRLGREDFIAAVRRIQARSGGAR